MADHVVVNVPEEVNGAETNGGGDVEQDDGAENSPSRPRSNKINGQPSPRASHLLLQGDGPISDRYDDTLLHRAVSDGGRWAYGVVLVEVWVLAAHRTQLYRPEGGWWIDPVIHVDCSGEDCQLCRLTNPSRKQYIPPEPEYPGEGLPGVLWVDSSRLGGNGSSSEDSRMRRGSWGSTSRKRMGGKEPDPGAPLDAFKSNQSKNVAWRDVRALAEDPDQAWSPRLQLLNDMGLGWAAGVPFNVHGTKGLVIYMARKTVDLRRMQSESNERYLVTAAALMGAAYAIRGPRHEMMMERHRALEDVIRRVRTKILAYVRAGKVLSEVASEANKPPRRLSPLSSFIHEFENVREWGTHLRQWRRQVKKKLVSTAIKSKGGGGSPPPRFSWRQSAWTFVGVFLTILTLSRLDLAIDETLGRDYSIQIGPFGAMLTLLYGLTSAPASQPRNAIFGNVVAITVGLCLSYATGMALWVRQSLATAIAIASMVKLGITHPPAGAAALLFSSGNEGWGNMLMNIVANVIAVIFATIINNMSDYRQYPTYWGFRFLEPLTDMCKRSRDKDS